MLTEWPASASTAHLVASQPTTVTWIRLADEIRIWVSNLFCTFGPAGCGATFLALNGGSTLIRRSLEPGMPDGIPGHRSSFERSFPSNCRTSFPLYHRHSCVVSRWRFFSTIQSIAYNKACYKFIPIRFCWRTRLKKRLGDLIVNNNCNPFTLSCSSSIYVFSHVWFSI